jgi:hypothetical protein
VADRGGNSAGWNPQSPNAKGNFQFDRVVAGWRNMPILDLGLKR